ncbi:Fanconi anemia group M protein [Elgaria multicarinata webbii]|uniref:Fanconi anemia group M protein n=1 Tax=Elgaria multicarinata webbii TaxID=159646 RepID=UPI002FCCE48F
MKGRGGAKQATLFQAWGARPAPAEAAAEGPPPLPGPACHPEAPGGFVGGAPGAVWLFPCGPGVEERPYQVRAAQAALEANTLLCLPTGLGKTLVAAVVLGNFCRWFPGGKAVFLAPTKPLVAQQRRACARLMALPAAHAAEMTGGTQIVDRKEIWRSKRVFFLTPQIMTNDLSRGICPAAEIKCLVIDEAHKALGNYAYCQVVKELCKYTQQFRILALTATPGSDAKAVQQVISNLLISHIELCSEDSPDIQPYSFERQVEKCVVPLGKELAEIQNAYIQVLEAFAGRLIRLRVLSQREIPALTKYQIILARDQFRKNPASHFVGKQQGVIEGDFALCISLYHGYELLLQMGMRSLFIFLCGIMDGTKGMTRAKNELMRNEDFMTLYSQLENLFSDTTVTTENGNSTKPGAGNRKPFIYSHPKLKKLEDVVVGHFRSWKEHGDQNASEGKPADTRVMIFSSFRDSVHEIAEMLSQHYPVVRVMTFVGHSTGKSTRGFTQKEQLEVVKHFREGGYNTLVSTCVGEEGLDIGEVDLIVCFDAQKSPIRLVQRMGRTGRKRKGRIVVILSEGREERTYNQSQSNRRSLLKALSENKGLHLYQHSPRMIPDGINPKMHRMPITPVEEAAGTSRRSLKERRGDTLLPRWLPYSAGTGPKEDNPTDEWGLTSEELERWNRLYKMKAGDGIKKPVMPQGHFETLEDEKKETELQAEEVHELSLTEWRLWQNRPFPTYQVDHSDRCCHFIGIMEMIEQMRHEEGACSYELNIQPYFHWDDVDASDVQRSKCRRDAVVAQKASWSRHIPADASKARCCSSSLEEPDAEGLSLFKAATLKSAKRPPVPRGETESLLPFVEVAGHKRFPDENKGKLDESVRVSILQRSSADHGSAAEREFQPASEGCSSGNGHCVDPGCGCLAEDHLLLSSSLFYLPAPENDLFALSGANADEDPSWRNEILTNVARLLSQSPPSPNEFFDFEGSGENAVRIQRLGSVQQRVSSVFPDNPPEKQIPFTNSSTASQNPSEPIDPRKLCSLNNCPLETSCISEASISKINDLNWDEIFDCDHEENVGIQGENLPVANCGPTMNTSGRCQESCKRSDDVSVNLLEGGHSVESNHPPDRKGRKISVLSNEAGISERRPSCELAPLSHASPLNSLVIHTDEALEVAGDLDHANHQLHDELYDASEDLFSVNFDLGFSVQESEDETSEQISNLKDGQSQVTVHSANAKASPSNSSNLARESPSTWSNGCLDRTKFSTPLHLQNQNSDIATIENIDPLASPLMPTGDKLCRSPDSVQAVLSTPTGRPVRHVSFPRRVSLGSFSRKGQESPPVPVPSQANAGTVQVSANSAFETEALGTQQTRKAENKNLNGSKVFCAEVGASPESEEEIVFLRKKKRNGNILTSPNVNHSDFESPIHAVKKRRRPFIESDLSSDESPGFPEKSNRRLGDMKSWTKKRAEGMKRQKKGAGAGTGKAVKYFIDEEAELSEEGAMEVSSDESVCSENEPSFSLMQFLNDEAQITQDLNESEMQAVYLESVRSPAVGNRFKMVHKGRNSLAVFSQVPEQDESYLEDSFCVDDNEEGDPQSGSGEEDEVCVNFNLLQEESFANGRKQYCTRRRRKLKEARVGQGVETPLLPKKLSRIRILDSSSEDEGGLSSEVPTEPPSTTKAGKPALDRSLNHKMSAPKRRIPPPQESRAQVLLGLKACLSEELDFRPPCKDQGKWELVDRGPQPTLKPERSSGQLPALCSSPSTRLSSGSLGNQAPLCILVDSREISSGPDVISTLKAVHGVKIQVCSLGSCDYVVSNRLAVERKCQAELLNGAIRNKVVQRVQELKSKFDRICVIVEKERVKAGEARRAFHRTKHYDGMLSAFIRAGIKVLFSSSQEETADLLKELALVEQRKNAAILLPTEVVEGPRQERLRFYLSIPCVSYTLALALCQCFGSVKEMANSSPSEVAARTRVTPQKAEEVYHYIRYGFDAQLLPEMIT